MEKGRNTSMEKRSCCKITSEKCKHVVLHGRSYKGIASFCDSKPLEMYACVYCQFNTNLKVDLTEHLRVFHGGKHAYEEMKNILKFYHCRNCDFETHSSLVFTRHVADCKNRIKRPEIHKLGSTSKDHGDLHISRDTVPPLFCETIHDTVVPLFSESEVNMDQPDINSVQHISQSNPVPDLHISHDKAVPLFCETEVNMNQTKINSVQHISQSNPVPDLHISHDTVDPLFCETTRETVVLLFSVSEVNMNQPEINSVQHILRNNPIPDNQKNLIKQKGRPTPDLQINSLTVNKSRTYKRNFNKNIYDKYEWICGCPVLNKLFCFVCMLVTKSVSPWTKDGVNDLKHLPERAKKHQSSIAHLNASMDFGALGKVSIASQLNSAYLRNKVKHNEEVEKNRHILRRLVMCIRFCGAFELASRGHDENKSSDNPGIYMGLINFAAELDAALAVHLKEAKVFKDTPKNIQNELLDAMLVVYKTELIKQIKSANFIALEVDETTDTSNHQQLMVVIFRYVISGQICEQFWSFIGPEELTANVLLVELQQVLSPSDNFKLISQSYDGASVMSGKNNGVQAIIRKTFPYAHHIHCYAHQFNSITEQAAQCHKRVKIFFANLESFSSFFSPSSKRISVLHEVVTRRVAYSVPTRCNFNSRTVNTVFEHKDSIIECLEKIIDTPGVDSKTISEACSLLNHLQSSEFLYWLKIFHFIMPHVEVLFNEAETCGNERSQLEESVKQFERHIERVKSSIDHMTENEEEPAAKRQKTSESSRSIVAKQVCDDISVQIKERFDFKDHLSAAKLFDSNYFMTYRGAFPQNHFDATVKSYSVLNSAQLKSELTVIYQRDDMCTLDGILYLLVFLEDNNLKTVFSETYKLLDIICTTPMPTSESERCFSTLKRIKTFLKCTILEDRLNALAVLSIEKTFIQGIPDFENKVIDIFCNAKNRRKDFAFR